MTNIWLQPGCEQLSNEYLVGGCAMSSAQIASAQNALYMLFFAKHMDRRGVHRIRQGYGGKLCSGIVNSNAAVVIFTNFMSMEVSTGQCKHSDLHVLLRVQRI